MRKAAKFSETKIQVFSYQALSSYEVAYGVGCITGLAEAVRRKSKILIGVGGRFVSFIGQRNPAAGNANSRASPSCFGTELEVSDRQDGADRVC